MRTLPMQEDFYVGAVKFATLRNKESIETTFECIDDLRLVYKAWNFTKELDIFNVWFWCKP
jgi:hypothetical protein